MRGKPPYAQAAIFRRRITPAGAGKTITRGVVVDVKLDHPRRCGENIVMQLIAWMT